MDRKWIHSRRTTEEYAKGVSEFIAFAIKHAEDPKFILCPCVNCNNMIKRTVEDVEMHLVVYGIVQTYKCWIKHGESFGNVSSPIDTRMPDVTNNVDVNDGMEEDFTLNHDNLEEMMQILEENKGGTSNLFDTICSDAKKPLYPGCSDFSRLSMVLKLYNLKARGGWSDQSFTDLLGLLKEALPYENVLPDRTYEAKKLLTSIGMGVEKINACPNDCILYRKEYASLDSCPICKTSRYDKENVPAKVMWYFPIVPRFRRLFSIAEEATKLTWHKDGREVDGILRHPADSPQWTLIDRDFEAFGHEPRNLRLALAADGMNPFGNQSTRHSTWPIILMIYNLPPELIMKRKYMMLSILISGPKQPGNDIDVYLEPLIEDLVMMWNSGVEVYDAHRNENFNLKAMLFGTINDFPAYGNLAGYSVKGFEACPVCEANTYSLSLHKVVYPEFRRFLPQKHQYRRWRKAFNGETEEGRAPVPPTGEEILEKMEKLDVRPGKLNTKTIPTCGHKRRSKFFDLPYWKTLYVRHFLDVMHIEKNVCESIINTLLNVPGKTKDNERARDDLVSLNIRTELAPVKKGNGTYLPPACYTLSKKEKTVFCEFLHGVKVPEGYSSNIRRFVSLKDRKLIGLKSHDYHILMEHLLPVAIRSILPERVRNAITNLCLFFSEICKKEIDPSKLVTLQTNLAVTLCQLEMFFPPAFFDIMIHLTVHLVREIKLCGPAYFRYMYPVERFMKILKGYVKGGSHPEGCIVERYLVEEALEFCSQYLANVEAIGIPKARHKGGFEGKGLGGAQVVSLSREEWEQAHLYVLHNSAEVDPYVQEHMQYLLHLYPRKSEVWRTEEHNRSFIEWFRARIADEVSHSSQEVSDRLKWLSRGPSFDVFSFRGYQINGYTFHTKSRDDETTMQNSGVAVLAQAMHISSTKDKNPVYAKMTYYGAIERILELDYKKFKIPIFSCTWANNNGVHVDKHGMTTVDLNRVSYKDEPFIFASQAKQVFFVSDPSNRRLSVVLSSNKRHAPEDHETFEIDDIEDRSMSYQYESFGNNICEDELYIRDDHDEGIWVEEDEPSPSSKKTKKTKKRKRSKKH